MNTFFLYSVTVLIWGTTWYAIKLQIGEASPELSIFCRATLAAFFLLSWCAIKGYSLRFSLKDHLFLAALGLTMFSIHHICIYHATHYIVSGVVAVVFSGVSFLSILHNFIFYGVRPRWNLVLGACIGIMGVFSFFSRDILNLTLGDSALKGLFLAILGCLIFSLGSVVSKRNHQEGLPIVPSLALGMLYGALALTLYMLVYQIPFYIPTTLTFWSSLLYLVIPGSIIGFFCYLKLIRSIGPERAGFATVLFPVVALGVSYLLEHYIFSPFDLIGLAFVLFGNLLVLKRVPSKT